VTCAAVGLGDLDYAKAFREESGIKFPLLVDADRKAYKTLGLHRANLLHLLRRDNHAARKRAKTSGHRQHKLGNDPFQLGGSFVFAPGNRDIFAHISETFGDNAAIETIIQAIP